MSVIEWRREARRIHLPVIILRSFPAAEFHGAAATALVDTGATISGVARRIAAALGLPGRGRQPLVSAQGLGDLERYEFRVGLMPDHSPTDTPRSPFVFDQVIGIELSDSFEFDALLGMDVLSQCDFAMYRRGACRLAFG
jgi:hypothetical protein